jgi:hypothetical protein
VFFLDFYLYRTHWTVGLKQVDHEAKESWRNSFDRLLHPCILF